MRTCILILIAALGSSPTWAEGPAVSGLERLAIVLPGTWKTAGQTLGSQFTKAGPQTYTTVRDCWREVDEFKCVSVVNGQLQLFDIFTWNAQDGLYRETQITSHGRQPDFHLSVQGNTWTYDQNIESKDGEVIHYRIVRNYNAPTSVNYLYEYSLDGRTWTPIAKGMETRLN